mgnify:CR=1 FL=1
MLKFSTYKPDELPIAYKSQIHDIIGMVVRDKKDKYWKNYQDFSIQDQTAISVGCDNGKVQIIATIYHRPFFGKDVYRLWNRFLYSPDFRETGGTKTRDGEHINHPLLKQQIDYVKTLNPKFYFVSRQRKNTRWLKYYFDKYNKEYNDTLVVSDVQYWVCNSTAENCCQTIIFPKEMQIPLRKGV